MKVRFKSSVVSTNDIEWLNENPQPHKLTVSITDAGDYPTRAILIEESPYVVAQGGYYSMTYKFSSGLECKEFIKLIKTHIEELVKSHRKRVQKAIEASPRIDEEVEF